MARDFQRLEKGIKIEGENSNDGVYILFGSAIAGTNAQENDASIGSIYQRTNGELYQKTASGSGTDKWIRLATLNDISLLKWRIEKVQALTANVAPTSGSSLDFASFNFSDDDTPFLDESNFAVNDYVLFGKGGTPKLMRVSAISGTEVTFVDASPALNTNDIFIVNNYLPDSPDAQEKEAIILYNGSDYVKFGDFNWDLATGINLSSSYSAATGNPSVGDTVESAIAKIDGNVDALTSAVGIAQGNVNMGTFTGTTVLTNNTTVKANLQELGNEAKSVRDSLGNGAGASTMGSYTGSILTDNTTAKVNIQELATSLENSIYRSNANAVTTAVTLDEVLVDSVRGVVWDIVASLDSTPARVKMLSIHAFHNGTAANDATATDDSVSSKLSIGTNFDVNVNIDLNGAGASQTMRVRVSATAAVSVYAVRRVIS